MNQYKQQLLEVRGEAFLMQIANLVVFAVFSMNDEQTICAMIVNISLLLLAAA